MSQTNPYQSPSAYAQIAAQADLTDRLGFIRRTYFHLAAAVIALIAIEVMVFMFFEPQLAQFAQFVMGGQMIWLGMLIAFMAVSWLADHWARTGASQPKQYAGLALYVVAESVILAPLLWIANEFFPGAIQTAAFATIGIFVVLTAIVFITRQDFSFLRNALMIGGFAAIGCVVVLMVVPNMFPNVDIRAIDLVFSFAMVALASGYILYKTSNVLHHYYTDQHVAAALALFSSVALLFWYVLRIVMASRR